MLGQLREGLVHVERLLELRENIVGGLIREVADLGLGLTCARAHAVDAEAPRELSDPGANCIVVAERVEPLVDPREHVLEDVLRVVRRQPEALDCDRVDVTREAVDKLAPGLVIAFTAACDEGGVGELGGQR